MESSLVNPNQLRHHGVKVQDNPMSEDPLSIISEDEEFGMELKMKGTIVYANTFTPSNAELESCQRIHLTSQHPWEPNEVKFPKSKNTLEDMIGSTRMISALRSDGFNEEEDLDGVHHAFNLESIHRKIASMKAIDVQDTSQSTPTMIKEDRIDPGEIDVSDLPVFNRPERQLIYQSISRP